MNTKMDDVVFLKFDVDERGNLAHEHKINAIDKLTFYKNSEKVETIRECEASENQIKETIVANK